jgi:hypothetical protein
MLAATNPVSCERHFNALNAYNDYHADLAGRGDNAVAAAEWLPVANHVVH